MNAIKNKLQEFIEEIELAKKHCTRDDFLKAYNIAIQLSKDLILKDSYIKNDFEMLNRFVSDCLPWSESILKIWNSLNKKRNRL